MSVDLERVKQVLLTNDLSERMFHFLYEKGGIRGGTEGRKCMNTVSKITGWSNQYLVSESHIFLNDIYNWPWEIYIGELLSYQTEQTLEEDIYKMLLIVWRMITPIEDLEYMERGSDEAALKMDFDFGFSPEKCTIVKKEEFISALQKQFFGSKEKFEAYQKNSSSSMVIHSIAPQYRKLLDRMNYLQKSLGECKIICFNDFDYEIIWYFIFNEDGKIYSIYMEKFAW